MYETISNGFKDIITLSLLVLFYIGEACLKQPEGLQIESQTYNKKKRWLKKSK